MLGYYKILPPKNLHPMFLYYGTFAVKNIKDGDKLYYGGKYLTYNNILELFREDVTKARDMIAEKFKNKPQLAEQLTYFDNLIENSDLKYTLEFGTITNISRIISDFCKAESQNLKTSKFLDQLVSGLKLATYIAFAAACITIVLKDCGISDKDRQDRIDSIVEDFYNVANRLQQ